MELYKQARKAAGVYAVRNTATGRVLLGSSVNLHGPLNRHRTELKLGSHRCAELQADWNRLGQDAFVFEILDKVPDELAGLERDEALRQLELKCACRVPAVRASAATTRARRSASGSSDPDGRSPPPSRRLRMSVRRILEPGAAAPLAAGAARGAACRRAPPAPSFRRPTSPTPPCAST